MPCSLAFPCGGQARLVLVLPDAALYECVGAAHTIRIGAPPPVKRVGPEPLTDAERAKRRRRNERYARRGRPSRYCRRGQCRGRPTTGSDYCYPHRPK